MAKDDPPKPKPWTPDQPLEDEEDEEKAQAIARARARTEYLVDNYKKPPKPGKKSFNPFGE